MHDSRPDLSALVKRPNVQAPSKLRRAAWLLPVTLFGGFAFVFLILFKEHLIPARVVEVTPAIAIEAKPATDPEPASDTHEAPPSNSGTMLFQASGWIEPDPLPIKATALTDGVIDQIHVHEGDLVKKGQPLATLIAIDSELARDAAASELDILKAQLNAQSEETEIARRRLDAEHAGLLADGADADEAKDRLDRVNRIAESALPETERVASRLDYERKQAAILGRKARISEIQHQIQRIAHHTTALAAGVRAAEIKLAQSELALERTRISSPVDGRVLRLLAAPGQKKMAAMDDVDSSTIAILYQPDSLQVRVDVPLADAAALGVGQRARIRCNLLPDLVFDGEVTRIGGEADVQRNSLQAKVRIIRPTDQLRPEMLCRVEFLESTSRKPNSPDTPTGTTTTLAVHVPLAAIRDQQLWVCDPETHRVSRRSINPSGEAREGYQRLESGVLPGEWIVLDPSNLQLNQRVNPKLQ